MYYSIEVDHISEAKKYSISIWYKSMTSVFIIECKIL